MYRDFIKIREVTTESKNTVRNQYFTLGKVTQSGTHRKESLMPIYPLISNISILFGSY